MIRTPVGTRHIDSPDFRIRRLGFGAWELDGRGWSFGWGPRDGSDSVAAIREALDFGVCWIDTGPGRDLVGSGEMDVERSASSHHERLCVFAKCGLIIEEGRRGREPRHSQWPASIRQECEASLRQLGVERIDLYRLLRLPGVTMPASAVVVAWTLTSWGVARAIVGAGSAGQIEGWVDAVVLVLSRANPGEIATAIGRTCTCRGPELPAVLAA